MIFTTLALYSCLALSKAPGIDAFQIPFPIQAGGECIGGYHPSPTFFDWDGDGLDDVLLGIRDISCGARLKIYRNVGAPGAPRFEWLEDFKIGGAEPRLPGG